MARFFDIFRKKKEINNNSQRPHKFLQTYPDIDFKEIKAIITKEDSIDREDYIIIKYHIVPNDNVSLNQAAARVAIVTSLRTLVPLPFETEECRLSQAGMVLSVEPSGGLISIGYPLGICSVNEGLAQLLLVIFTGVEYDYTKEFWVEEITLPRCLLERYKGPKFGINGIRDLLFIKSRPIIGVTIKPRSSVSIDKVAEEYYEALVGGADYIVDDLLLVDPNSDLAFSKRLARLSKTANRASSKTGEKKWYIANIGNSPRKAFEYAQIAQNEGANALKINGFIMGFPTLEELVSNPDINLPIITTNMGVGLLTRASSSDGAVITTGVSEAVISKISRLAGADGVHLGTVNSGCFAQDSWDPALVTLRAPLNNIISSMAVIEGGVTLANVCENIATFGPDVMVEICNGIMNYPGGPAKGASAFRILFESTSFCESLKEVNETVLEIARKDRNFSHGLEYFGYKPNNQG